MMLDRLNIAYDDAVSNYQANGRTDYDAGIVAGIKIAIEIVEYNELLKNTPLHLRLQF
ncbi:MAG: hypothetical protein JEZ04_10910 [Spirochaetales bacterium]|nr:hypothetical protein [Spirochaetales bacterium]